MAITAVVTLTDDSVVAEMATTATVEISNSGGSDVTVLGLAPSASPSGATEGSVSVALGEALNGPGQNVTVPASGALSLSFSVVAHAPKVTPASFAYDIGAVVRTSDGATTYATADALTVSARS